MSTYTYYIPTHTPSYYNNFMLLNIPNNYTTPSSTSPNLLQSALQHVCERACACARDHLYDQYWIEAADVSTAGEATDQASREVHSCDSHICHTSLHSPFRRKWQPASEKIHTCYCCYILNRY